MNIQRLLAPMLVILALLGASIAFVKFLDREESTDYKNAEYLIEGTSVRLSDVPGADGAVTRYFGNDLVVDINGDGRSDVVFLVTRSGSGSGTFFYAVGAVATEGGYAGSDGYLLGDRIAPQAIEVSKNSRHQGVIVVNYADRAPGEPMTAEPSVGKSTLLKLDTETMRFGVVEPDFSGEADPSRMSLDMKAWEWQSALYEDGRLVEPRQPGRFVLSFGRDGAFSARTDCNSMSGSYSADAGSISFGQIAMTKMFCEGSQESEFAAFLRDADTFIFTTKGELVLKADGRSVVFR